MNSSELHSRLKKVTEITAHELWRSAGGTQMGELSQGSNVPIPTQHYKSLRVVVIELRMSISHSHGTFVGNWKTVSPVPVRCRLLSLK